MTAISGRINPYLQSPINSNDESDVISGQTHRGQYDHHGNKSSLWDSSCTDAGGRGGDAERTQREAGYIYHHRM